MPVSLKIIDNFKILLMCKDIKAKFFNKRFIYKDNFLRLLLIIFRNYTSLINIDFLCHFLTFSVLDIQGQKLKIKLNKQQADLIIMIE